MSKIKLVVEIDERIMKHIKAKNVPLSEFDDVCQAVENGTPITDDMISREALKKELHKYVGLTPEDMEDIINNAPTVEPICPYLSDNEVKQPCLNSPCERPKDEWKHIIEEDNDVECPFCGFQEDGIYYNFCPRCGADMRGDENGKS